MEFTFDLQLFADVALTLDGVSIAEGKFSVVPTLEGYTYSIIDDGDKVKVELPGEPPVELGTFSIVDAENGYVSFSANEALGGVLESSESTITIADGSGIFLREANFSAVTSSGIGMDVRGNTKFSHLIGTYALQDDVIWFGDARHIIYPNT